MCRVLRFGVYGVLGLGLRTLLLVSRREGFVLVPHGLLDDICHKAAAFPTKHKGRTRQYCIFSGSSL